jgi:AAA+ ATPase superfamily predicted ATPase
MKHNVWYQKKGYSENPLSVKPKDEHALIGREDIVADMVHAIKSEHISLLLGQYGFGKTSILKRIIKLFKGQKKVIYFSCNRLTGPLDVDKLLYDRRTITQLLKIKSKKMILLLDEVEYLTSADFVKIMDYHQKKYFQSIVLVTNFKQTIPANVLKLTGENIFELKALSSQQAIELVRSRIGDSTVLTDAVITKVYATEPRIRRFLKNCEYILKSFDEHHRTHARPIDVLKLLKKEQLAITK